MLDYFGDYTVSDPLQHARFTRTAREFLNEDAFEVLGTAFIELHRRAAARLGKPRWADKNPENAIHLEHWERLLGDRWLFVHVLRDPRDVLASMEEAGFPYSGEDRSSMRCAHIERYARSGLEYAARNRERSITLRYESLIADPGSQIERLMEFLGELPEKAQLDIEGGEQRGLGDPKAPGRGEFDRSNVGRWRRDLERRDLALVRDAMTTLPPVAPDVREGDASPD